MRGLAVSLALASGLLLIAASPQHGLAAEKIRLAQTSAVTNCMMACGSQAALCQAACVVPGTAPTGAATITSNANSSTSCQDPAALLPVGLRAQFAFALVRALAFSRARRSFP